jgi:hypothetical protein
VIGRHTSAPSAAACVTLVYVEGENVIIEARWANNKYEQLPGMAAELVQHSHLAL